MKKYLFLLVSILSIFLVSDRVEALSYTVNDKEIEVTEENYIYYFYTLQQENFETYDYFVAYKNDTGAYRLFFTNTIPSRSHFYFNGNYLYLISSSIRCDFDDSFNFISCKTVSNVTYTNANLYSNFYSNSDLYSIDNSVFHSANITKQDLIDYFGTKAIYTITYYLNDEIYQTIEVEEGTSHELLSYSYNENLYNFSGWTIETENVDLSNITSDIVIKAALTEKELIPVYIEFPITKTEFYALLVEVGVLIMIIFLKWCFPFKGGSDLR